MTPPPKPDISAALAQAFKAGVEIAAGIAAQERPAPSMDEVHAALVEQYDAMLEYMEAFTNKPCEEMTPAEIRRWDAAAERYRETEQKVMGMSYPLWRAQNLERSIVVNAHCDGRIRGFLPPLPRPDYEEEEND
jgi:L-serine deaminase